MRALFQKLLLALILSAPIAANAACTGEDLRPRLESAAQSEMEALVAALPYAEGNHWRATRGDQTINLIGTIHLFDPRLADITRRLAPTVQAADLLMVEITEDEEAAMQRAIATDPAIAFLTSGPSLIDRVSPDVWSVLSDAARERGIPPFMAAKYQPWFLSLTLSLAVCAMDDLRAGRTGLDKMIMSVAAAADVPVLPLETHGELIDLLAADPIDEQVRFLPLVAEMQDTVDDATATTIAGYFEERHGEILAFSRVFTRDRVDFPAQEFDDLFDEMMAMMLDQRNAAWMSRIDTRAENRIVIAVGAAHLGGPSGLVNQLALRGYTVERQAF